MFHYIIFAVTVLSLLGCAAESRVQKTASQRPYEVDGKRYEPLDSANGYTETGIASWYGRDFHGRKTSNGETYNMYAMTAAHKTLPLGTYVKVTRHDNNKAVTVRINDRGPFVKGRIVDLSYKAAETLGMAGRGTTMVTLEALGEKVGDSYIAKDYRMGSFTIQVGAFKVKDNAVNLKERLNKEFGDATIQVYDRGDEIFYRVRVGRYSTLRDAEKRRDNFIEKGFALPFVVSVQ